MAGGQQAWRDWHRRFGLLLMDLFTGTPFAVEVERDLSVQQQLLDVVIVRRGRGRLVGRLPDGLEGLRAHNLVTFKSHHEALDNWAVKELVAHSVAYRKLVSPSPSNLLPEEQFGLYAVAVRFPQGLARRDDWQRVRPGVYNCPWGSDMVRVVVAGELPQEPHNAPLHLFSARPELIGYGGRTYRPRSEETSRLLLDLFRGFEAEGVGMPYTMKDFEKDYFRRRFLELPPKERLEALQTLSREDREKLIQGLPPEERLAGLPPEERLAGLSPEQIQQYLDRLGGGQPASARKPRRKK